MGVVCLVNLGAGGVAILSLPLFIITLFLHLLSPSKAMSVTPDLPADLVRIKEDDGGSPHDKGDKFRGLLNSLHDATIRWRR